MKQRLIKAALLLFGLAAILNAGGAPHMIRRIPFIG